MNYKKSAGYKHFRSRKMAIKGQSTGATGDKMTMVSGGGHPVTKQYGHGKPGESGGEYGTKHQSGLPTPKGMKKKSYSRSAIHAALGGGQGSWSETRTKGMAAPVK